MISRTCRYRRAHFRDQCIQRPLENLRKSAESVDTTIVGFSVTIERRSRASGKLEEHTFPSRTKFVSLARQAAQYKYGFLRIIKVEPLTAAAFAARFPARQKGARP
jgi:hypothetical protein